MRGRRGVGLCGGIEGEMAAGRVAAVCANGIGERGDSGRGCVYDAAECSGGEVGMGRKGI